MFSSSFKVADLETNIQKQPNTEKCDNKFRKEIFKLLSIACVGKTMENVRHRENTKFVENATKAKRYTLKPNILTFQKFHSNLVSLNFSRISVFWNKPTPVWAAILNLSKIVLYNYHYIEMKPRYGEKVTVVYKDTDSLLHRIETEVYKHGNLQNYLGFV